VGGVVPVEGDSLDFTDFSGTVDNDHPAGTVFRAINISKGTVRFAGNPLGIFDRIDVTGLYAFGIVNGLFNDVTLYEPATFSSENSATYLAVEGTLDLNGNTLILDGAGWSRIKGPIVGPGEIIVRQSHRWIDSASHFDGSITIESGDGPINYLEFTGPLTVFDGATSLKSGAHSGRSK